MIMHGKKIPGIFCSRKSNEYRLQGNIAIKLRYYFWKRSLAYSSLYMNREGDAEFAKRWQKPAMNCIHQYLQWFIPTIPTLISGMAFMSMLL